MIWFLGVLFRYLLLVPVRLAILATGLFYLLISTWLLQFVKVSQSPSIP